MPLPRARKARLQQIVRAQRCKAPAELPFHPQPPLHRRLEVVVDAARHHPAEMLEGAHMPVQERDLVAAFVEPREVVARVHQVHHEQPHALPRAGNLHGHLEEVHLRGVPSAPHQRYVHLLPLTPPLGQVRAHCRAPHLVALSQQLLMYQRPGDPLLAAGPLPPLLQDLFDPLAHRVQHRLRAPACLAPPWLPLRSHILAHRVPAHPQISRDLSDRQPFVVPLVFDNVYAIHPQHPSLRFSSMFEQHQTTNRR